MTTTVLAHGVGDRQDLPIPFSYALMGAVVALVITFVVLAFAWREPQYDAATAGRPLPSWLAGVVDAPATRIGLAILGVVIAGYVAVAAIFGPDRATNPTAGVVYVLLWVGIVPLALLFGPVYARLNPLRTLHRWVCRAAGVDPAAGGLHSYPVRLGMWPAAAGLLAFTWLELVAPDRATLPVIRTWFAIFMAVSLVGAALLGSGWFTNADPFEAWSRLAARLSWVGRRGDGVLVARSPLAGLDGTPPLPGLAAVVCVLLGSTAYDSLTGHPSFGRWLRDSPLPETLTATLALVAFVSFVGLTYSAAVALSGRLAHVRRTQLPNLFAHSLVPIAVGYIVAHYFTLLVLEGQTTLVYLSDPLGTGANLLGTADWTPNRWIARQPELVATVQVGAVIVGHVVGVVAAHDRAVRLFPRRQALLGQLPLLVVMVGYTLGGLWLLFSA